MQNSQFIYFILLLSLLLGILRVLIQPIEDSSRAIPVWQLYNNQGPTWNFAQARLNEERDFSIILEGTWGPNRASGSIAVDDLTFYTGNCTGFDSAFLF